MTARGPVLAVFLCVACLCFVRLGSSALWETDEGFAGTRADSFLRHGGWLLSYDEVNDDAPQFRKPPLLYWLVAALLATLGHTTWAVRLPTAFAGFLAAWLLYRLARGALGEGAALLAALAACAVPFYVLHVRTAMLELPVICALLGGLAAALLLPETPWRPVAVGLCGGAALMIKAGGGLPAVVVPLLFGLVRQRLRGRAWVEALIALAVAAALPALWYAALPPEYRERVVRDLILGESAKRLRRPDSVLAQLSEGGRALALMLRWHLPAALCGVALALTRCPRRRELARWLAVTLAVVAPLLWAYGAMRPPYPRYLLPAVPFLLSFSAYFALEAAAARAAALLLIPVAAAALVMAPGDPWSLLPVLAAAVVAAAVWCGWAPAGQRRRLAVGSAFLAAIAAASWFSPSAWSMHPPPRQQPRPELVPLLRQAAALIPEESPLIVEDGITVHTMLFYGRRPIQSHGHWALTAIVPGEIRYGVFQGAPLRDTPGIAEEELGRSGTWRLVRISVARDGGPLRGILYAKEAQREALDNTLRLLGVGFESFGRGFILRTLPTDTDEVEPGAGRLRQGLPSFGSGTAGRGEPPPVGTQQGEAIVMEFPSPRRIAGVEIYPESRRADLAGWVVEAGAADGSWAEVARIGSPLEPYLAVDRARVRKASRPAARVRFEPVLARRLRVVRAGAAPVEVERVRVLESRPAS